MSAVSDVKSLPTPVGSDIRNSKVEILKSTPHRESALSTNLRVALLTGGGDKPYALGIAAAITSAGVTADFIGSDYLAVPEVTRNPKVKFFNLRGDQRSDVSALAKIARVAKYYLRLLGYATTAQPRVFHILWNNKVELFDRTLLTLYYKVLGKRIVLTAHNVNAAKRDLNDSSLNRLSLKLQYKLSDRIFVHTDAMKRELVAEYEIANSKVIVIPFGINNTVPRTDLSSAEAKRRLGISSSHKAILFFGNIAPYKGLEYLVNAFVDLAIRDTSYRLIIVGKPKGSEEYWSSIKKKIDQTGVHDRTIQVIDYIPDEATELYFKAADVAVLPYTRVFQSGVLFLSYSFGLPVIVADVASLKEEIVEGKTGFTFTPCDSEDLAGKIGKYFESNLFRDLGRHRIAIKEYANQRYSWDKVARITTSVYTTLLSKLEDRDAGSGKVTE